MPATTDRETPIFLQGDIEAVIRLVCELTLRSPSRGQRVESLVQNLKQLLCADSACVFETRGDAVGIMMELHRDNWSDWQTDELSNHLSGRTLSEISREPITMEWPDGGNAKKASTPYHCLSSCLPAGTNYFITFAFARRAQPFSKRETVLLRTIHQSEIASLVSPTRTQNSAVLTGRMREVLARLMDGDSEKQIARKLQLSQHTIHEHVKLIYRRYKVNSRGELLSLSVDPIERLRLLQS